MALAFKLLCVIGIIGQHRGDVEHELVVVPVRMVAVRTSLIV